MFHCPVTVPQKVFHCPANRVSFHGSPDNEMCLIVRYSMSVPRTCFTAFELSKYFPYFPEAEHRRFHRFAQENSAIVLASMLACRSFLPERIFADKRTIEANVCATATVDLNINQNRSLVAASREVLLGKQDLPESNRKKCLPADRQSCFIASMIISLVNSKGGVGKSTLAGNLAGWLARHGRSVILADCDTQQSSSEWITEALPELQVVRLADADAVLDELPSLAREFDFVIADGPGSQTETSRALLMWADLAILPCKASMFEARALNKNTAFVRQAQAIRKGPPEVIAVLNMVGREYRLTRDMREAAAGLGLKIAETAVTLRQAYADAPGQATFVWNMGYAARGAAEEIEQLFQELFLEIAGVNQHAQTRAYGNP